MRCCLVPEEWQRNNVTKELLVIVVPLRTLVPEEDRAGNSRRRLTGCKITVKGSARLQRVGGGGGGGQAGRYGLLAHGKALTASHIEELGDSEIERLYARYEARLRGR